MTIEIIKNRIKTYSPNSVQEENNAIKEIYQEIALAGLARQGFFDIAAFQGGTCLRILYDLNRFSENLDFVLLDPDKTFNWGSFLKGVEEEFVLYDIHLKVRSPECNDSTVQKAILKDDSFLKFFELDYDRNKSHKQKLFIKFEVDVHPPQGSCYETHYLDFPLPFSIGVQGRPSLFAGKCHALLCRPFLKGRDWYDFLWYVGQKIPVNLLLLKNSLVQTNDWKWEEQEAMSIDMLMELLQKKVIEIDWKMAAEDVLAFVKPMEREIVKGWSKGLFLSYIGKMKSFLSRNEVVKK